MNIWISNILRFAICILLQVLIINNLNVMGICTPLLYVYFLIALPPQLPRWAELLIGAATGLIIDIFCNSLGINMAACVLVSYLRPLLLSAMVQEKQRLTETINSKNIGMATYLRLIAIIIAAHHTVVIMLDSFTFHYFYLTLLNIILSSVITFLLIAGYELLEQR